MANGLLNGIEDIIEAHHYGAEDFIEEDADLVIVNLNLWSALLIKNRHVRRQYFEVKDVTLMLPVSLHYRVHHGDNNAIGNPVYQIKMEPVHNPGNILFFS